MTRYLGGKQRISKSIYKTITDVEEALDWEDSDYLEPFMGMMSVALLFAHRENNKGPGETRRKITGSDSNTDVTVFWRDLKDGVEIPVFISEKEYNKLKDEPDTSLRKTIAAYQYSFGGAPWNGYIGKYESLSDIKKRGKLLKQKLENIRDELLPWIKINASRSYKSYRPHNKLIYCDPPYTDVKINSRNRYLLNFDSEEFWNIMTKWSRDNLVFISEEEDQIPSSYKGLYRTVWCKSVVRSASLCNNNPIRKTECLFLHKRWADKCRDVWS